MTELEQFQRLKEHVLLEYRKHFPYFQGNWKTFTSQDIQNLIGLIESNLRQTVSEKWIYTHLKPETNDKLPRKDMLDIFSRFAGFSGWDEFVFTDEKAVDKPPVKSRTRLILLVISMLLIMALFMVFKLGSNSQTIQLKDEFTREKLDSSEVKVYQVEKGEKIPLEVKNSSVSINKGSETKVVIESPYYKKKEVILSPNEPVKTQILVKPDDRAMMLKAFMKSDIKDWQTRKVQLQEILSDDLEVIVMLRDNLGAEYLNKEEFSGKLTVPTETVKKMKIIELKSDGQNRIVFIRIKQE